MDKQRLLTRLVKLRDSLATYEYSQTAEMWGQVQNAVEEIHATDPVLQESFGGAIASNKPVESRRFVNLLIEELRKKM